jgi:hypothetical protein
VAFGRPFLANPDLIKRLATGAPLNQPNYGTLYTELPGTCRMNRGEGGAPLLNCFSKYPEALSFLPGSASPFGRPPTGGTRAYAPCGNRQGPGGLSADGC